MVNEGRSLDKIIAKGINIQTFQLLLFNIAHLLRGLILLNEHSLIHGDIKMENVVLNEVSGTCKYIDYDFMGTTEEYRVADEAHRLFPRRHKSKTYFLWPPERFTIAGKFRNVTIDSYTTEMWITLGFVSLYDIADIQILDSLFRSGRIDKTRKPSSEWVKKLLTAYGENHLQSDQFSKIDIYGFGIMVSQLLKGRFQYILPSMRRPIKTWLSFLVHPDPSVRYSPQYALQIWERIFSGMSIPPFMLTLPRPVDIVAVAKRYPATVTFYRLVSYVYLFDGLDVTSLRSIVNYELSQPKLRVLLSDLIYVANQIQDVSLLVQIFKKYESTVIHLKQNDLKRILEQDLQLSGNIEPIRYAFSQRRRK